MSNENLKKIEQVGMTAELDGIITNFLAKADEQLSAKFKAVIDEKGTSDAAMVQLVGEATRAGAVKQGMFKAIVEFGKRVQAKSQEMGLAEAPASKKPTKAAPTDGAPASSEAKEKATRAPRAHGIDLAAHRGPSDPYLLKYHVPADAFPAPIEIWWPKKDSAVRKLHEFLAATEGVTLEELIAEGAKTGAWSEPQAKKQWAYFQSQSMAQAGWHLQIDEGTKKGKMVTLPANWDFRTNTAITG